MSMSSVRLRGFPGSNGLSASLAFYTPGAAHRPHSHDYMQLSFLLSGEMLERHGTREWTPLNTAVGLKPAGLQHENRWGREGVLIFSLKLKGTERENMAAAIEPGWAPAASPSLGPDLVRTWLEVSDEARREEVAIDLLSLPLMGVERASDDPPPWLERVRTAIREAPDVVRIAEAAELAGVHRVRFSALFKAYFGLPPSLYRHKVMTARALALVAAGKASMTTIAHEAGFSDQAHLTRSIKRYTGLAPKRLRALFA